MKNVAVLSHIADMDGIGSAALVKIKYKIPSGNIFFTGHSREETQEAEKGLRKLYKNKILLFITDLTPEMEAAPLYDKILKGVKGNGGKVVFLDHHHWDPKMVERFAKEAHIAVFGENKHMCGTDLVKKYTGLNTPYVKKFTKIVHHADFYLMLEEKAHAKIVDDYAMALAYINMSKSYKKRINELRRIINLISSGKVSDKKLETMASTFRKLNDERISNMLKDIHYPSEKMGVGFTKQVDSTEACMAIINQKHVGIGIAINLDHVKGSIRSKSKDVVKLASALGGGGHPHAAGFIINGKRYNFFRTKKDKVRFVEHIKKVAGRLGLT